MTNPINFAADTPKPEANPPIVEPTTPDQGSPAQDKPEPKTTDGK